MIRMLVPSLTLVLAAGLVAAMTSGVDAKGVPGEGGCTEPLFILEGSQGRSIGSYYAHSNIWNDNGHIAQKMGVCSDSSWYVEVTAPDHEDRAVLSYPNMHRDWHNWSTGFEPRIDSFTTITSAFAHHAPPRGRGIWNVAYDIWINGVGHRPGTTELMIWTENSGQRPAGSLRSTVTVDGREWQLWTTNSNHIVTYLAIEPLTSGTLDLKAFLQHMMDTGRLARESTLGQIGYGVEIVQTGGELLRFEFAGFSAEAF